MKRLGYTCIELQAGEGSEMTAAGKLNGKKVNLSLDTGATITAIDRSVGRSLPRLDPKVRQVDDPVLGLLSDKDLVVVEELKLGTVEFRNLPAIVMDASVHYTPSGSLAAHPSLATNPKPRLFQVLLGGDFLLRNHSVLHVGANCLYVRATAPSPAVAEVLEASLLQSRMARIPLTSHLETLFLVGLTVQDQPFTFLLDTGSFITTLDAKCAATLSLSREETPIRGVGVKGWSSALRMARSARLSLGPRTFAEYPIGIAELHPWLKSNDTNAPVVQGLMGPDLLSRANAIIDFRGSRMFVSTGSATPRKVASDTRSK
jgi:predicted aspartyl protease